MDSLLSLQLFARVVETGSFSKAAGERGLAQSTATKAIARIEERLGARLLHRSTRGVTPTEIGALFYEKCKAIVRDVEEAENLATLLQSAPSGQLRVSTSVAFGRRVLVPLALAAMLLADVVPAAKARKQAGQLWRWIHHYGVTDFSAMTNIA